MPSPTFVLLYVRDPLASATFYAKLLGSPAREASPGFAMFDLAPGTMLGLWRRDDVLPHPVVGPGAAEVAFSVTDAAAVHARCAAWRGLGVRIVQEPGPMDFGFTFVGTDPDGHRLRVFAAAG
ncbi:MAG TPA: VOC family protein [Burkholderiaceae bacterium]|nr:VOC family protein [Burkholderiaceae bacterium]